MQRAHTHYDNLKVSRDAPASVIRAAYRTLSQQYHPDRSTHRDAARIMTILNVSYAVLSDETKRRDYDALIAQQEAVTWSRSEPDTEPTVPQQPEPSPSWTTPVEPNGLRSVPTRLWVLALIIVCYTAWIGWDRLTAKDEPVYSSAVKFAPAAANLASIQESPSSHFGAPTKATDIPAPPAIRSAPEKPTVANSSRVHGRDAKLRDQPEIDEPQKSMDADEREQQVESEAPVSVGSQQVNIQVAAMSSAVKAAEVQAKLRDAGLATYTEKTPSGLIRIKMQFNKADEKMLRDRLAKLGL